MLAIFTVLPFLYVVPMCLPRVELVPCWIFKNPGSVLGGNCWGGTRMGLWGRFSPEIMGLKPGFSESPDVICLFVQRMSRDTTA